MCIIFSLDVIHLFKAVNSLPLAKNYSRQPMMVAEKPLKQIEEQKKEAMLDHANSSSSPIVSYSGQKPVANKRSASEARTPETFPLSPQTPKMQSIPVTESMFLITLWLMFTDGPLFHKILFYTVPSTRTGVLSQQFIVYVTTGRFAKPSRGNKEDLDQRIRTAILVHIRSHSMCVYMGRRGGSMEELLFACRMSQVQSLVSPIWLPVWLQASFYTVFVALKNSLYQ